MCAKIQQQLKCPKCLTSINLPELFLTEISDSLQKEMEADFQAKEEKLRQTMKKQLEKESTAQIRLMREELDEKSEKLSKMNLLVSEVEKTKRDLSELESTIIAQKDKELNERLEKERKVIMEQADEANSLKLKEREMVISQLRDKLDAAKRSADQGSMQIQGETAERALEEILENLYPLDSVIPIKTGQSGGDSVQIVRNKNNKEVGRILWESKSTKAFSYGWLKKLKEDNLKLKIKSDIKVLITSAMPKEMENDKYGLVDEIWLCRLSDVKELSMMLRFGLLKVHAVTTKQSGKDTKMVRLYDYLVSTEFAAIFQNILDGYSCLQDSHMAEKRKIQNLWQLREKQLDQILADSINFYSSIKSIAGESIPEFKLLEFPDNKKLDK